MAQQKKADPRIQQLRSLFRNLHAFRALYETDGISEITGPDGISYSLWDLEELYHVAVGTALLPFRQRQAIELFLVLNMSEDSVAEQMQIKKTNPVGMYGTSGLQHLLKEMDDGNIINLWAEEEFNEETG